MFSINTREDVENAMIQAGVVCILVGVYQFFMTYLFAESLIVRDFGWLFWGAAAGESAIYVLLAVGFFRRWSWSIWAAPFVYLAIKAGAVALGAPVTSVLGVIPLIVMFSLGRATYAAWKHPEKVRVERMPETDAVV